jgi:hypothetical protein
MNKFVAFGLLIVIGCGFQGKTNEFIDKQFKWKMVVPAGFERTGNEQIQQYANTGTHAISQTTETEVENLGAVICLYQKNGKDGFTASFRKYDSETDGNLSEICRNTKELLCETFQAQIKGTRTDTASSMEIIDSLEFNVIKIFVHYPNRKKLTMLFYERIFDDKLFSFNINFVDAKIGAEILEAWKKSKFGGV